VQEAAVASNYSPPSVIDLDPQKREDGKERMVVGSSRIDR
jgi:hypothetical protein